MVKPLISVVICTKNRHPKLEDCLISLLDNSFTNFEVIVVDQSNNQLSEEIVKKIKSEKIRYFRQKVTGKSKGLNFALEIARGKIIAFTDDDCLANKDWLLSIASNFSIHKEASGVFGKVIPYKKTYSNGKYCPSIKGFNKVKIFSNICPHWIIGFGNNMAFRKEVFKKIGVFKNWLGPGSIGKNGEDAEFTLRLLANGYKILYSPKIFVYHNRWLTKEEYRKTYLIYASGSCAAYGYLSLKRIKLANKIIIREFTDSFNKLKKGFCIKDIHPRQLTNAIQELFYRIYGLMIGYSFYLNDEVLNCLPFHRKP